MFVKVNCEHKISDQQLHETMNGSIRRYFGEVGLSRIDPKIIEFNTNSSTAILSYERAAAADFETSMALITKESDLPMTVLVLRVSGTVKAIRRQR
jgi:RNase P/RNase MRP subunit POP5